MFDEVQKWVPHKLPKVAAVIMHIEEIYNGVFPLRVIKRRIQKYTMMTKPRNQYKQTET